VPHLAQAIAQLVTSDAYGTFHMAGVGAATRWDLVVELFRILRINTVVQPVSSRAFPASARRPVYSVLTTVQTPRIELPPWQEGVGEFASRIG
jgi:dTDP-4-dehydrorhamnose reductase